MSPIRNVVCRIICHNETSSTISPFDVNIVVVQLISIGSHGCLPSNLLKLPSFKCVNSTPRNYKYSQFRMADYNISSRAYTKMILHAAKYPHCAVNGVLLSSGKEGAGSSRSSVHIDDVIPLFHQCLNVSPMAEVALVQVIFIKIWCMNTICLSRPAQRKGFGHF